MFYVTRSALDSTNSSSRSRRVGTGRVRGGVLMVAVAVAAVVAVAGATGAVPVAAARTGASATTGGAHGRAGVRACTWRCAARGAASS